MSDETKWTPGPWEMGWMPADEQCRHTVETADRGQVIATKIRSVADAQILAAAPDLYEALAEIVRVLDSLGGVQSSRVIAARAALAKARGERGSR
jgi:hypothetical protein